VGANSAQVDTLALVAPGDPERSYLVMKVRGDEGILGKVMPPGGKRLADESMAALVAWVSGMAPADAEGRDREDADDDADDAGDRDADEGDEGEHGGEAGDTD
jgi:hypothetical protein